MQITHDLAIGGLQQVVVNICRNIDRRRFDISVLCLREKGDFAREIEREGIPVYQLPKNADGSPDYLSFWKIAQILRRKKTEIIHTHNTQPFVEGTLGSFFSRVRTIVHTDHARDFPDKKRYMVAEWFASKFTYRVVGVSEHTTNNLMRYEKISPHRLVTIPNGIDEEKFSVRIDVRKKREEVGIRSHGPVIGVGVRLTEQKGLTYLVRAMPSVLKDIPDAELVIAGEGPLAGPLQKEAASLGIGESVHFIGPRLDIPELLQMFDLYVLPSLWEGLPMVLLEAMAAGCPVIATNVGGNSTVITHGYNGSLIEPRNPGLLAAEIVKIASQPTVREAYRHRSREIIHRQYSIDTMVKKYEQLYLRTTVNTGSAGERDHEYATAHNQRGNG